MLRVLCTAIMLVSLAASAAPGNVSINSPPGKVCEDCADNIHWYQQESIRSLRYAQNPPDMPQPFICNEADRKVSCSGRDMSPYELYKFPGLVYVMLYIEVDADINNPWRFALNQVRKLNNTFQLSGVPVQFIVTEIKTVEWDGSSMVAQLNDLQGRMDEISRRNGADLGMKLLPDYFNTWRYCGVAKVGTTSWPRASVTGCYSNNMTLAHEVGHNFGLRHDVGDDTVIQGGVGYRLPEDNTRGTIMTYAEKRIPFFSNPNTKYDGLIWGSEEANAAAVLNDTLGNIAMAHETMMNTSQNFIDLDLDASKSSIEYCE
jgi:hypothetical protein